MRERHVDHLIYLHGRGAKRTDDRWLHDGLNPLLQLLDRRPVASHIQLCRPYYADIISAKKPPEAAYPHPMVEERDGAWHAAGVRYAERLGELTELRGWRPKPGIQGRFLDGLPADTGARLYVRRRMPDVHRYATSDATRRAVIERVHAALPTSGRAVLVAHSLGTVVALDLLHYLPDGLTIELLVTLGSPLALKPLRDELMGAGYTWPCQHLRGWVNAYDPADFVTAGEALEPIFDDEVLDVQVDNGRKEVHRGYRYLSHGTLGRMLGPFLTEPRTTGIPDDLDGSVLDAALIRALARRIEAETPPGSERRLQMARARERTEQSLLKGVQREHPAIRSLAFSLELLGEWLGDDVSRLERLAALYFANPFAPFEVDYREHEQAEGIRAVGLELGVPKRHIEKLLRAVREAEKVHDPGRPWGKIVAGAGVAVLVLAAPYAVVGLGAAGGLAGGAAIAHGLAAVGSVVGGGMLGGIGTVGAVTAGGAALVARQVTKLTTEQLESELVRLQALAKLEHDLDVGSRGQAAISALKDLQKELRRLRDDHLDVEGPKSAAATAIEGKLEAIRRALEWLQRKLSQDRAEGQQLSYPVGSLVRARGREWVVLPETDDDMLMVRPVGGSEDETTGLLLSLEGAGVEPATFPLPDPDEVGDFRSSRLLRDALRLGFRASAGPFRSFGRIAVSPRPYQLVPLLMALKLDAVRMLIADDVGIGKTIESLLIARELIDQGDVSRLTVLCSPQLAEQWQREMREKFHLEAELVLPSTVRRLERRLTVGESLFDVYPFTVVSTDYIKSDRRRDDFLRAAPELVIVDEAHTCVEATTQGRGGRHQRYALLKGLASDQARNLLLVTATPHSGNEHAFRALLGLLDPAFEQLPDDLTGDAHEGMRRRLAQHFVQRRRADIRSYLDEDTTFPARETSEVTYRLHADYARLFDRCLELARETALDSSGGAHRQRVRWWSALALLRSLASSPAAAAATLRNRAAAADAATVPEADAIGRRTVLDLAEDDAAEAADVPPGSDPDEPDDDQRFRRRLRALANDADALVGDKDAKLANVTKMVKELIKDGYDPILFCRFIPTAEYVAEHLRGALGSKVSVASVTGTLPPDEREARVEALGQAGGRKVLVSTDCMSEGINLQQHFDAVIHYDLSWNPTRHEQREGRVDRFNQPSPTVRTVTYYGEDNRIDRIVLDVLLRKHERIRSSLGISVPVPGNSDQVVEAIMEGLITREDHGEQLVIEEVAKEEQRTLFAAWEDAAEREKRSRTMFAQRGIHVDEVARELDAVRRAIGSDERVGEFLTDAARELGATVAERDGAVHLDFAEAPRTVRDLLGPEWQRSQRGSTRHHATARSTCRGRTRWWSRSHNTCSRPLSTPTPTGSPRVVAR
jgi:superfamily II DNA or RNA helicase